MSALYTMRPETKEDLDELVKAIHDDPLQYRARYMKFGVSDPDLANKIKNFSEKELINYLVDIVTTRYKIHLSQKNYLTA